MLEQGKGKSQRNRDRVLKERILFCFTAKQGRVRGFDPRSPRGPPRPLLWKRLPRPCFPLTHPRHRELGGSKIRGGKGRRLEMRRDSARMLGTSGRCKIQARGHCGKAWPQKVWQNHGPASHQPSYRTLTLM